MRLDREEKRKNDLADAVLAAAAFEKIKSVGGVEKAGGLLWGILLVLGGIAAVLAPVVVVLSILIEHLNWQEAFEELGPLFGIIYIWVYLLIRWLLRKLIKIVTRDPQYFDDKKTIMEISQGIGCVMIIVSIIIAFSVVLSDANMCWFYIIAFTGCFIPFSRFLPSGEAEMIEKDEDDFEQF